MDCIKMEPKSGDALTWHPTGVVMSWITRSLRGPSAETARNLGHVPLQVIPDKLETMHGTETSYSVMMNKFFNITQIKSEKVSYFATRLETTMADIRKDHLAKMARASAENH